uniref:PUM-HD domain-containing protein n=1 Tax=Ganoderma boninense TaxID=34458 RepID=A0A5K1K8I3_9APHY|nr:PUM-HD domain-containing protein [Ganoderma boninense]
MYGFTAIVNDRLIKRLLHQSPIQAIVKTPGPECPKSEPESDYYYTHLEDWLLDPRQGSDGCFAQYSEDCRAQQELPFHRRAIWQGTFIPTLLRFLGTRNDPWDFSGDALMTILPDIWLNVYHEPSWPSEDDALIRSLVSDSVVSWFESFASNALAAVEKFLKGSVDDPPSFSEWSEKCEGLMRDYRALDHPGGLGCSAIDGGKQVEGQACSSDGLEYPFGAIGLAAAAAFRAMQLFRAQLVGYGEDGKIFIETSTVDIAEPFIMEAAFSKNTAEERTKRLSSFAYNLPRCKLDAILWQAQEFVLYPDYDEINFDDEYDVA